MELEKIKNQLFKYITFDGITSSSIAFNGPLAKKQQQSKRIIRIGQYLNQFRPQMIAGLKIPIYGNWCGPGHGGGKPVDRLDRGCMYHDLCYERQGWGRCRCDRALLYTIRKNYPLMKPSERDYAAAIYTYFAFVVKHKLCVV